MKNTIYTKIQESQKITFDDLYKKCTDLNISKQELGQQLRLLESDKAVFQYNNHYHDLAVYPIFEGYSQWSLNGFCWLEDKNTANAYGVSFNTSDDLTSIYNKRDTFYGSYVKGRQITEDDKTFVIVTESNPIMDLKIIATFDEPKKQWVIINSNTSFTIPHEKMDVQNGDISVFNFSHSENTYSFESQLGNKNDYGIESVVIKTLCEIQTAPTSNFTQLASASTKLNKAFYTIDSISTSDVDDAIFIEKNDTGYKLFVAIADVSSYVLPGDIQDQHAKENCTSFYLPHQVTHMLDRKLAENFCSLNVGETKTALVCEMDFDIQGKMLSKDFYQAQVTIEARLSYDDVDKIIIGQNPQESLLYKNNVVQKFNQLQDANVIVESLKHLEQFSTLNPRHQERNYFIVENPEFHLGEDGKVDYLYFRDESQPSQKMVESAMLPANIAAAEYISENDPDFQTQEEAGIFRNQSAPLGQDRPKPASYGSTNAGHWGLQTNSYTHFTSPIRRYCDLVVHRLIKSIINKEPKLYSLEDLNNISQQINVQQYKAKQISIKSKNLLVGEYLEKLTSTGQIDGKLEIVDFSANGLVCRNKQLIDVFIPTFKLESYVTRVLNKFLPADGSEPELEVKKAAVTQLNNTWDVYMQLGQFTWTDERKNALYQFQKKQYQNKPQMK